jgi:hypothetical protein
MSYDKDLRRLRWLLLALAAGNGGTVAGNIAHGNYLVGIACFFWLCACGVALSLLSALQQTRDEVRILTAALKAGPPASISEEDL